MRSRSFMLNCYDNISYKEYAMRYYCSECKSELTVFYDGIAKKEYDCDVCMGYMQPIPDFETPDQYKERTGREWKGAVWVKYYDDGEWFLNNYFTVMKGKYALCANQDIPPPDDWKE